MQTSLKYVILMQPVSESSQEVRWRDVKGTKTKNDRLSPVDQIFKNKQDVAYQQADGTYFAGQYKRYLSVVERLNAQILL